MILAAEVPVAHDERADEPEAMASPYEADEPYYTAERIDSLLRNWAALISSAEGTRSPALAASGAQPGTGFQRDTMKAADVIADIERAWVHLPYLSLGQRVIQHRMLHSGLALDGIAHVLRVRYEDVLAANRDALGAMAAFLERVVEDRSDLQESEDVLA